MGTREFSVTDYIDKSFIENSSMIELWYVTKKNH